HTFDELQSFSEPPLTKCPACKKNKLERLFGGGGAIIFKGSGFYETDYRRPGTNGKAETPDAGATKSESKPEAASGTGTDSASSGSDTPAAKKTGDKGGAKKAK